MSGIAGIVRFDGGPIELGMIEKMTAAMAYRGPDGINHWVRGSVALGQCMLRTTPESREETQPLANEDEGLVLVMDGRVDNWLDLRRELIEHGAVLRTRSDAELVLRAYEVWGEACVNRIIGECVFLVWDARLRILFGGRDAAGTRHFYYHEGKGWFSFASEIKGLLELSHIEQRLNESRLVDYLVEDFDREDEIGTFYQGVVRLPAGHAMRVGIGGVKTWRWWNPGELERASYSSLDECAEAFREQLEIAVKCRLRNIGPICAELSGGLDSSAIVAVIGNAYRTDFGEPLRTFSLIRSDRENCPDWRSVRHMLNDKWLSPTVITSDLPVDVCRAFLDAIPTADEPFAFPVCLPLFVVYSAAHASGCRVILEGMAGDLLFYAYDRSLDAVRRAKLYTWLPAVLTAAKRHRLAGARRLLARRLLAAIAPDWLRAAYRNLRDRKAAPRGLDQQLLRPYQFESLAQRYAQRYRNQARLRSASDQALHAQVFTSGYLSFAHELSGEMALSRGLEPRSPYSDRRMIELAIRMPVEAKLCATWYKHLLRIGMRGMLPEAVRWRSEVGFHPGWAFYRSLMEKTVAPSESATKDVVENSMVGRWVDIEAYNRMSRVSPPEELNATFRVFVLSEWLKLHQALVPHVSPGESD
jgi:asparagine synthase (glutamine-hydrolysing)